MAAKSKWISTEFPGVRYREHPTRKHGKTPDRYYSIRYYLRYKDFEEGLGWASEGWNAKKASLLLADLRRSHLTGEGPQSLSEMRAQHDAKRQTAERDRMARQVQDMSLTRFLRDHYLPWAKREKRSWRSDEIRIERNIIPQLGAMPLRMITRQDVENLRDYLRADGLAEATVLQYLAVLRKAFNLASQTVVEAIPLFEGANPVKGVKLPKPRNARVRFLSYAEADALIVAAKARGWMDLHDAIIVSLNTGLRRGEILRLEWSDVDLAHGVVTVREEDQRKPGGSAYVNEDCRTILQKRLENRFGDDQRVFPPPRGGVHRRNLSSLFGELIDALGWNEGVTDSRQFVVFHTLRHTFASWLAMAGTDIFRIKELMRHKTIQMTMRYAHLIPDTKRAAVNNLRPRACEDVPGVAAPADPAPISDAQAPTSRRSKPAATASGKRRTRQA